MQEKSVGKAWGGFGDSVQINTKGHYETEVVTVMTAVMEMGKMEMEDGEKQSWKAVVAAFEILTICGLVAELHVWIVFEFGSGAGDGRVQPVLEFDEGYEQDVLEAGFAMEQV